jgi:hypothetical protein
LCSVRSLRAGRSDPVSLFEFLLPGVGFSLSCLHIAGFGFLLLSLFHSPELFLVRRHQSPSPAQFCVFLPAAGGSPFSRSPPVCTCMVVIPGWLIVRLVFVLAPSGSCFGFCSRELLARQGFSPRARSGFPALAAIFYSVCYRRSFPLEDLPARES